MRYPFTLSIMAVLATSVVGCANVPRDAGFADVRDRVIDRVKMDVQWNQGSDADAAVAKRVHAMLQTELSAEQAVQIALLNNRRLQATYEDLMVAQADLVLAGLLRNPVFDAEIRFPASGSGGTGLEMALVQDFIDIFYIPLRKRMAGAEFDAAKSRVTGAVLDLAGEVRLAFYDVQSAQQMLEMRRQIVTATEASYDIARRLREAGNIRELNVATERVLYEESRLQVRAAEAAVVQSRERLNRLMGLWGEQTTWTAAARLPDLPADDATIADVEKRAVEKSLDLELARAHFVSAGASLDAAAPMGLLPEAEIGVSAEREPDGEWAVGPAFSLPIPLFDQGQPAVAAANAKLRRARQQLHATAVEVRSHARAARDAVVAAREQADYYRKVVLPLRQKVVDETQLQYNAMQVSPLQLLQARQQQIDAGTTYIRLLRSYWRARASLDLILSGRLPTSEPGSLEALESNSSSATGRGDH